MKKLHIKNQLGMSMVELMISLTVASILSLAVLASFASQGEIFINQNRRVQSYDDGRMVFDVLTRLLRHAESDSITVTDNGTDLVAQFTLPAGYPIWPNVESGFTQNHIFIKWADHDDAANGFYKDQIRLAKASTASVPASDQFTTLAGSDNGSNTRITDLNINLQADTRNYRLSLNASAGNIKKSIVSRFDGLVMPRN